MIRRIHMIESGGRGGVFNHSVEVASGLHDLGMRVVLHTATDMEELPSAVEVCQCIRWSRRPSHRRVRQLETTARYMARTLPHMLRVITANDVVHIQGLFALTPELITVARLRGATVVCSPHNTFARHGAPGATRTLRSLLSRADRVLVYSGADADRLTSIRSRVAQVPLVQWTPVVEPELVARWRKRLSPDGARLALMPGQVRADKNPHEFVRAIAMMSGWRGAIVGDDLGPGAELDRLVKELDAPVTSQYGYLDVAGFTAVVAAADVVVAPYEVASQSGVVAVAAKLGVPTAVGPVGGLRELGTAVARDNSAGSIRDAIEQAVARGATPTSTVDAAKLYVAEYEAAQRQQHARPEGGNT